MKLDFSVLSRPGTVQHARTAGGQVGTVGTQAPVRTLAADGAGDRPGTSGDAGKAANTERGEIVGAGVATPCPLTSPARPRPPCAWKRREINVFPLSPTVPSRRSNVSAGDAFDREAFEERAAILEFDAGLARHEAEETARLLLERVA